MPTINWDEMMAEFDERDRQMDLFRQRSPILWWLRYRPIAWFYAAKRTAAHWYDVLFYGLPFRLKHGFWASDCWSLDATIARFALPRLRHLRTVCHGHPGGVTWDEWQWILHEIEWFLEWHDDMDKRHHNIDERARYENAGMLFGKYFGALWD